MIPKSKHVITQYLEIFSPSQGDLLGMLATIDLDDKLGLQAEEIDDVGSKDLLTSKLDAVESVDRAIDSTSTAPPRSNSSAVPGSDCSSILLSRRHRPRAAADPDLRASDRGQPRSRDRG